MPLEPARGIISQMVMGPLICQSDSAGIGTARRSHWLSHGCRGVIGPVPRPLLMRDDIRCDGSIEKMKLPIIPCWTQAEVEYNTNGKRPLGRFVRSKQMEGNDRYASRSGSPGVWECGAGAGGTADPQGSDAP